MKTFLKLIGTVFGSFAIVFVSAGISTFIFASEEAPGWYIAITFVIAILFLVIMPIMIVWKRRVKKQFDVKNTKPSFPDNTNRRKEAALQSEDSSDPEDIEIQALCLLDTGKSLAFQLNHSHTVEDFENSYTMLINTLYQLAWINEKENVPMSPPPRNDLNRINANIELTVTSFIERASAKIDESMTDKASKYEILASQIESSQVLRPLLTEQHRLKIIELREKAKIERENEVKEAIKKKGEVNLVKLGYENNLDLSEVDPMDVITTIERKLSSMYSFYLSSGQLSLEEGEHAFTSFINSCTSSKLPLAAEIRLESLIDQYKPKFSAESPMYAIDHMEGHEFEKWCGGILKRNGFSNVEVTQGSHDQGVDILAQKDGINYAIQCKCYTSDLGNKPVQEVHTGQSVYHCQVGVVMTNRFFTSGAKEAAEATGVLLWDRNKLVEMLGSKMT